MVIHNMLMSLLRADADVVDDDEDIVCEIYKDYYDATDKTGVEDVDNSVQSAN